MNPQSPYEQGGQTPYQPQPLPQQPVQQPFIQQQPPQLQQPYAVPQQPAPQTGYSSALPAGVSPSPRRKSKVWLILTFVFLFTTIAAVGAGVWAYISFMDQRDNVDSKVSAAVITAVKQQQDKDAADYLEKEKQPNRQFAGPEDYGRLSFDYPKTWSNYVAKDASKGGNYEVYFNPVSVPPVTSTERFSLRVLIEEKDYDQVLKTYENLVSKGELVSSTVAADGVNGTRLDGNFSKDYKGSAVLFKIRDKTVTVRTDADTFKGDFDALIKTITFNK